jgi:hypothetical protein
MTPAANEVLTAVTKKIAPVPGIDRDESRLLAEAVTIMAAGLIQSAHSDGSNNPSTTLQLSCPDSGNNSFPEAELPGTHPTLPQCVDGGSRMRTSSDDLNKRR